MTFSNCRSTESTTSRDPRGSWINKNLKATSRRFLFNRGGDDDDSMNLSKVRQIDKQTMVCLSKKNSL